MPYLGKNENKVLSLLFKIHLNNSFQLAITTAGMYIKSFLLVLKENRIKSKVVCCK